MRRPLATLLTTALIGSGLAVALPTAAQAATGGSLIYGVTSNNELVSFRAETPGTMIGSPTPITNLGAGETVTGIDFRPATGGLFVTTDASKVYPLSTAGVAGTGQTLSTPFTGGSNLGMDFNPVPDRLRLNGGTSNQNLRINVANGSTSVDSPLSYAAGDPNAGDTPVVEAAAYTNSVFGVTTTTLYDIDTDNDVLVIQDPPNNGTLNTVGSLGVDVTGVAGLDADPTNNSLYALLGTASGVGFYRLAFDSGAATLVGNTAETDLIDITSAAPRYRVSATVVAEGDGTATVTVNRDGDLTDAATVSYATSDGTATAGEDYTAVSGSLAFAAGEGTKTFVVPVAAADLLVEGIERVLVTITPTSTGSGAAPGNATTAVSIVEPGKAYLLTPTNALRTLNFSNGALGGPVPVTGTSADIVGIDVRPATGALYAVTADSKLYTVVPSTGVATLASSLSVPLDGTAFGVDFNPVADRLRIVSDAEQNLRVNVDTGAVTVDDPINPAGDTVGAAYTNSSAGATTTTLYTLDSTTDTLNIQNPPNAGTQTNSLPLGVDTSNASDLDITPAGNAAFAVLSVGGIVGLYRVNLSTGSAGAITTFSTSTVEDVAILSPGRLGLSAASYAVAEAGPTATITVDRTASTVGTVTVDYATSDGLAKAGSDYTVTSGTLTFADGETSKSFTVAVAQDALVESAESFTVTLSNLTGGAGSATLTAPVTITDDETGTAYGLTTDNRVVTLDPTKPATAPSANVAVTGLNAGEDLLGIDVRPANGKLYGITSAGRILVIDPASGGTQVASTSSTLPSGAAFGVDVNPVADRLRVVSNTGQSLRINMDTGAATVDGSLAYANGDANSGAPSVTAAGYTNSTAGAASTQLFDIDTGKDVVVLQNPPNNGTLSTVGALGLDATSVAGLDIAAGNEAFAVLVPTGGVAGLYRLNTGTGAATLIGALATTTLEDIAFPAAAAAKAGGYHALPPTRLLDTRVNPPKLAGGTVKTVVVAGQGGVPATGVSAVVLNVTITQPSARGNVGVFPAGAQPANRTSNLNFAKQQTVAVQVQTGLGTGGAIGVLLNTGTAELVVDVLGWYGDGSDTSGLGYQSLSPRRLLDTRTPGAGGKVVGGTPRTVQVTGTNGVPTGASAVAVNLTVTDVSQTLNVSLFPGGTTPAQRTSSINATKGQTVANAAVVTLGADGSLGYSVSAGSVSVVLDVVGYYGATGTSRFTPITPARLLDTRTTGDNPLVAGSDRAVTVAGAGGVPASATGAVLSVTGTQTRGRPWLQVYPTGVTTERTSTLNLVEGADVPNLSVTQLGGGKASLRLSQFYTHVIVDVTGYFS